MSDELASTHEQPGAGRSFVATFAVTTLVMLAAIVAFNVYIKPLSVDGRDGDTGSSSNRSLQSIKADAVSELNNAPDVLFLGTGSSERIDPEHVRRLAGFNAFTGSVTDDTPADAYTMSKHVAERFPDKVPHIVYNIDVHRVLDPSVLTSSAQLSTPALRKQLTSSEALRLRMQRAVPYTTWEATRQSLKIARGNELDRGVPASSVRSDGYLEVPPLRTQDRGSKIQQQIDYYRRVLYIPHRFHARGADSRYFFDQLLRAANARGDEPSIVLAPIHPDFVEGVGADWYTQRDIVRDWLDDLRKDGRRFRVYDLTNPESFRGDLQGFADHVHMTDANINRMVAHLAQRGALDASKSKGQRGDS